MSRPRFQPWSPACVVNVLPTEPPRRSYDVSKDLGNYIVTTWCTQRRILFIAPSFWPDYFYFTVIWFRCMGILRFGSWITFNISSIIHFSRLNSMQITMWLKSNCTFEVCSIYIPTEKQSVGEKIKKYEYKSKLTF